jgi:catechol 2,3-dioxygenase-like lactoylglutathione lyase family enzyme
VTPHSRRIEGGKSVPRKPFSAAVLATLALAGLAAVAAETTVRARVDHIVLGVADLDRAVQDFERMTGVRPVPGGKHPAGTHNALVSLGDRIYLELLAVQPGATPPEHLRALAGLRRPTPIAWAVTSDDGAGLQSALTAAKFSLTERKAGSRTTPDGATLHWETFGLTTEWPEAPFFILWSPETPHPSKTSPSGCIVRRFAISSPRRGEMERLRKTLGLRIEVNQATEAAMRIELAGPKGSVVFESGRRSLQPDV